MHVVVAGGGALGAQLASALVGRGHGAVVVEGGAQQVAALRRVAPNVAVVAGDACVAETLEEAGALHADVLVACTGSDEDNLVIALLAKRQLEVPRVVARVNDEANRWLFDGSWGVDLAVSQVQVLVGVVEPAKDPEAG